jgi:guanyl-specific ribonuclease Sa
MAMLAAWLRFCPSSFCVSTQAVVAAFLSAGSTAAGVSDLPSSAATTDLVFRSANPGQMGQMKLPLHRGPRKPLVGHIQASWRWVWQIKLSESQPDSNKPLRWNQDNCLANFF